MSDDTNDNASVNEETRKQLNWDELGLSEASLASLKRMGFDKPTAVQQETLIPAQKGRDLMVQAQTGSGKTLAFGLPLIEMVDHKKDAVQALVLTPTRELALQVATEIIRIGDLAERAVVPVFGGASINVQIRKLQAGGKIVVGTPGRILDHISRGTLKLNKAAIVVLDEVDEMLDRGFLPDVNAILDLTPKKKQTMVFSATIPDDIRRMVMKRMNEPESIQIGESGYSVNLDVRHSCYKVSRLHKFVTLVNILQSVPRTKVLVFTNTKNDCERVAEYLHEEGLSVGFLDGDLSQSVRQITLQLFKDGALDVMVCTDVAARGIDIYGVSHVVNYDLPENKEMYLHRTGRTGRAGRKGEAVSLVAPNELLLIGDIEKQLGIKIEELPSPDKDSVAANFRKTLTERLKVMNEEGYADDLSILADELLDEVEPYALTAGLLTFLRQRGFSFSSGYDIDNPEHKIRLFARGAMLGKQDLAEKTQAKRDRRMGRDETNRERGGRKPERPARPARPERPVRTERPARPERSEIKPVRSDSESKDDKKSPARRKLAKMEKPVWLMLERGKGEGFENAAEVKAFICQNCGVKKGWLGDCKLQDDKIFQQLDQSVVEKVTSSLSAFKDERNIATKVVDKPE